MGISDLFSTFISTPGKVFNYVQENILKSPRQQKRPRDDSAGLERHEQPVARLKLSLPDPGDKADSRRGNLSGNTRQHLLDDRIVSGEVVSPPAHWLQKQQEARGLKRLPGALHYSSPAKRGKSNAAASPAQPLQLWSSIRNTRHGPQTGFRRAHTSVMPTTTPMLDPDEESQVRRRILEDLGQAGKVSLDADVKAAQAAAQRAAVLHKLQLRELQSAAGGRSSQPLSKMGTAQEKGRFMRHLDASSGALSKQSVTPALPRTPDQARQPFFTSATPLEEQQERAMRQVLREEEDLKRRELEKDKSKAAYQEVKARYRQAEENLRVIRDRAQRVVDGTDPGSTSRRGIQLALARDIKLAEEERRRWEALRERSLLQYAAAQPLPDEARPAAAAGVPGVLRRTESPGDSASSQLQQQRQGLKPTVPVQARKAPAVTKAVPKHQEEETVVLLSDSDEEEQQDEVEPEEEADEEEEVEEETEEESSLSEALEGVHVGDEVASAARQLSKKQQALAAKALGPGAADEIVAYHRPSNIEMPRRLLRCLRGLDWLNDEVINIYMGMLQVRDGERRKAGLGPKCHFFNSFFVNKLWQDAGAYCYANVARWTYQKKLQKQGQLSDTILEVDRVIMPVHLGNHWTCAVIDLAAKELVYHDSMGGRHMEIMKALRRYVADEYRDKLKQTVDTSKWKIRFPADIPYQTNGSDCGVFALQYAEHASRGAAFDFDQQDMPLLRLKIASDIMSLKIN